MNITIIPTIRSNLFTLKFSQEITQQTITLFNWLKQVEEVDLVYNIIDGVRVVDQYILDITLEDGANIKTIVDAVITILNKEIALDKTNS